MQITPVDDQHNLFVVQDIMPPGVVDCILQTDWLSLEYQKEKYQSNWKRRRIAESSLSWIEQWNEHMHSVWAEIIEKTQIKNALSYGNTAFWLDEPGFNVFMHTDGPLPGAMQLTWIGHESLGTTFYHSPSYKDVRHWFNFKPNHGYIMINQPTDGYQSLQWHAMMKPIPLNTFRLTSYTIINTYEQEP